MSSIVATIQPDCWGDFVVIGLFFLSAYLCELKEAGFFVQVMDSVYAVSSYIKGNHRNKKRIYWQMRRERKELVMSQKRRCKRRLYRQLKRIWLLENDVLEVSQEDQTA